VHEQRERVRGDGRRSRGDRLLGSCSRHDDLDLPGLELRTQFDEILLVEVVLERERLQGGLLDRRVLLCFLEERGDSKFKRGAQSSSLPSFVGVGRAQRAFAANHYNGPGGRRIPSWTKKIRRAGDAFVHLTG
jgi:hypothetical protein